MFVLPVFLLAYAGLAWSCWRGRRRSLWREAPRAHALAVGIVLLFILPIAIGLSRGNQSNFALILEHLRTHRIERHLWPAALKYVLDFNAYRPYRSEYYLVSDDAILGSAFSMLARHPEMTGLWTAALVLFAGGALVQRRFVFWAGVASTPAEESGRLRCRYLRWLGFFFVLSVAISLVWAHIQDGINGGASPVSTRWRPGCFCCGRSVSGALFNNEGTHYFVQVVRGIEKEDGLAPGDIRYVSFTPPAWDQALEVTLLLEQDGYVFRMASRAAYLCGESRTVRHPADALLMNNRASTWRVDDLVTGPYSPPDPARRPLRPGMAPASH